jgi:hypothetical protein
MVSESASAVSGASPDEDGTTGRFLVPFGREVRRLRNIPGRA